MRNGNFTLIFGPREGFPIYVGTHSGWRWTIAALRMRLCVIFTANPCLVPKNDGVVWRTAKTKKRTLISFLIKWKHYRTKFPLSRLEPDPRVVTTFSDI